MKVTGDLFILCEICEIDHRNVIQYNYFTKEKFNRKYEEERCRIFLSLSPLATFALICSWYLRLCFEISTLKGLSKLPSWKITLVQGFKILLNINLFSASTLSDFLASWLLPHFKMSFIF